MLVSTRSRTTIRDLAPTLLLVIALGTVLPAQSRAAAADVPVPENPAPVPEPPWWAKREAQADTPSGFDADWGTAWESQAVPDPPFERPPVPVRRPDELRSPDVTRGDLEVELIGREQAGNSFRHRTPLLHRAKRVVREVDRNELRLARLEAYESGRAATPELAGIDPSPLPSHRRGATRIDAGALPEHGGGMGGPAGALLLVAVLVSGLVAWRLHRRGHAPAP